MEKLYYNDFNMTKVDNEECWVRLSEINEMVRREILLLDRDKMKEYHLSRREKL